MPAQELERLAGILAHEIRNPLASATTNLAVACDLMEPSDPRAPFLRRAESELDRIGDLISACLELATAGRIQRQVVDLGPILQEASIRADVEGRGSGIDIEVEDELRFSLDSGLVIRCLENLIENARRECGSGECRILIQARSSREGLRIAVQDSGPGVPTSQRERIFDAFVSGGSGSGLGLCFVRLVVEAHGGTARVTQAPGGGARFELSFAEPEDRG